MRLRLCPCSPDAGDGWRALEATMHHFRLSIRMLPLGAGHSLLPPPLLPPLLLPPPAALLPHILACFMHWHSPCVLR